MANKNKFIIIGGSNIDYIGTSDQKITKKASNIGKISISFGGVGRNISENLLNLGAEVIFLTAIGDDSSGHQLTIYMRELGCDLIRPQTNLGTSSYMVVNDNNHDIVVGICDNRIIDEISPLFIAQNQNVFDESNYVGLDGNLSQTAIDYAFNSLKNKFIFVDPISPEKAKKFAKHLNKISLLKCNLKEACSILDLEEDSNSLCEKLLKAGVKNVVISNGAEPIVFGSKENGISIIETEKVKDIVNTTGCGDALTSGIMFALSKGKTLNAAVAFGNKLAKMTLFSESSTSKGVKNIQIDG